jgi:hypothetical protein
MTLLWLWQFGLLAKPPLSPAKSQHFVLTAGAARKVEAEDGGAV